MQKPKRFLRKAKAKSKKKVKQSTLNYIVKKVREIDKSDNKYSSANVNLYNLPTIVGQLSTTTLTGQAQGMHRDFTGQINLNAGSQNDRIRDRIKLKRLRLRYQLRVAPTSSIADLVLRCSYKVRVMVVYQKIVGNNQINTVSANTYPSIGQVLYVNQNCNTADLLTHQSWVNRNNIKIVYDKIHTLDPVYGSYIDGGLQNPVGAGKHTVYKQVNLDLGKLPHVQYINPPANNDSTLLTTTGRLMLLAWSDNVASNVKPIDMDYDYILTYDD